MWGVTILHDDHNLGDDGWKSKIKKIIKIEKLAFFQLPKSQILSSLTFGTGLALQYGLHHVMIFHQLKF